MTKDDKPIDLNTERKKRRQGFRRVRAYKNVDGHREKIFDSDERKDEGEDGESDPVTD